jgi:hypothetical protein
VLEMMQELDLAECPDRVRQAFEDLAYLLYGHIATRLQVLGGTVEVQGRESIRLNEAIARGFT